jgi:hypothetical protein
LLKRTYTQIKVLPFYLSFERIGPQNFYTSYTLTFFVFLSSFFLFFCIFLSLSLPPIALRHLHAAHFSHSQHTTTPTSGRASFASACTAALPDLPLTSSIYSIDARHGVTCWKKIGADTTTAAHHSIIHMRSFCR